MSLATSDGRRSASGIPFLPLGPGIVPGAVASFIRQQFGWGYSGLPVATVEVCYLLQQDGALEFTLEDDSGSLALEVCIADTGVFKFVYRQFRRLRARKANS